VGPTDAENPELHEALRIEWCKTRARAKRWQEDIELVREEMRRVLAYHKYKADEWESKANVRPALPDDYREGVSAYAHRQADIRTTMQSICEKAWRYVGTWIALEKGLMVDDAALEHEGVDES
ncbi:hypothetical protein EVJ58_g9986, partial [Rhodofomes roseus]